MAIATQAALFTVVEKMLKRDWKVHVVKTLLSGCRQNSAFVL